MDGKNFNSLSLLKLNTGVVFRLYMEKFLIMNFKNTCRCEKCTHYFEVYYSY